MNYITYLKSHKILITIVLFSVILPLFGASITNAPWLWPVSVALITPGLLLVLKRFHSISIQILFVLAASLVLFLLDIAYFTSYFLQNEGFNEAFFYHLRPDIIHAGIGEFRNLILLVLAYFLVLCALKSWYLFESKRLNRPGANYFLTVLILFLGLAAWPPLLSSLDAAQFLYPQNDSDPASISPASASSLADGADSIAARILSDLEDKPSLSVPGDVPKKNIVFIYLESVEQAYFDENRFPNLLPGLSSVRENSLDFMNLIQTPRTGWTTAGIVASQCGYPLFSPVVTAGNNYGVIKNFMSQAVCFGDLMDSVGYNLAYMGGADVRFAGKGNFFRTHGYSMVYGSKQLLPKLPRTTPVNSWGLYDDSLFSLAYEKFLTLSSAQKPFVLTLLNIATHHPYGLPHSSCAPYPEEDNLILHAVHCTDRVVSEFIKKIRNSRFNEQTVIIVMSDHLSMRNSAWDKLTSEEPRKLTFFLNFPDGRHKTYRSRGTHFDITPTVFDLLGFRMKGQLGLGQSLVSQDGYLYSIDEIESPSKVLSEKALVRHIKGLWQKKSFSLRGHDIVIDIYNLSISIGGNELDLRNKGVVDGITPAVLEFDAETLELKEAHFYSEKDPGKYGISKHLLDRPRSIFLAVGNAGLMPGFIEDVPLVAGSYFFGKPASFDTMQGPLDAVLTFIRADEIERIAAAPESDAALAEHKVKLIKRFNAWRRKAE